MDPCECVWDHEFTMRRLLNLLRNSQTLCTDTECFDEGTGPNSNAGMDNALLLTLIMTISLFLFFFRPRSEPNNADSKPINQNNDNFNNGSPPAPPPAAM